MPGKAGGTEAPQLPELSERDIVRHYTRLAHRNFSIDEGFYPLGSCTMKYNPKIAEVVAALPGFARLHPAQPPDQVQGVLELLCALEAGLCELAGMAAVTLQPAAGAAGELTGLTLIRAYHEARGERRTRVLIPDAAHGTNPASVRLAGYEVVEVPSDASGRVDVAALKQIVDDRVAALMLTNPNTLGLFERDITEIARLLHDCGAKLYYDGANLNAIVGRARPGDMGFDVVHLNVHKTFATPHGGGGPGAGPVGVTSDLVRFLPGPRPARLPDGSYGWRDEPDSIGRVHGWHGNIGILVRAYSYLISLGGPGLRRVSERAVLNANYLLGAGRRRLRRALPGAGHARVRRLGPPAAQGVRGARPRHRQVADRPGLPPHDRVLPAHRRRGDDDRADGDRVPRDPGCVRRRPPRARGGGGHRTGDAAAGSGEHARAPPGRGPRGSPPRAPVASGGGPGALTAGPILARGSAIGHVHARRAARRVGHGKVCVVHPQEQEAAQPGGPVSPDVSEAAPDLPLILLSHRGPVSFSRNADGERVVSKGSGGLVTALLGLAQYLDDAVWVCAAATEEDIAVAREAKRQPVRVITAPMPHVAEEGEDGPDVLVDMVEVDEERQTEFYGVFSNPILWFIQHGLYGLAESPVLTAAEHHAFEHGYAGVNEQMADELVRLVEERDGRALVLLQDYHFYLVADSVRRRCPDVVLSHFVHIPWPGPEAWRVLPPWIRQRAAARPARQRHRRLPHAPVRPQLRAVRAGAARVSTSTGTR